ncbi:HaeII family restriction endonuclease [Patescibacteria group bacterium]|nr:HaeII family restriction endonuclease [Patescibacteria group bacterium]
MPRNSRETFDAKKAVDSIIKKSRVHFYKPIQIAEILHRNRTQRGMDLRDLETYRNISKRWRDEVTMRLVGRRSTSSQKYQDNVFEENAMPPRLLVALGVINNFGGGFVEAYIYKTLLARFSIVHDVEKYVKNATPDSFDLKEFEAMFIQNPGLKRSVDKMYEISVYALFSTLVRALKAQVTIEVLNRDKEILHDFERFIRAVLGITPEVPKLVLPAALFRVGVTNAADRGLDMLANFGAAIQVKHLTLTTETLEDIADNIMADRIVVVCRDAEKDSIEALLAQVGWHERIQGIVTLQDLSDWYVACLSKKYRSTLGKTLLSDLVREFNAEFPSGEEIGPFMEERGYQANKMPDDWEIV